MEKRKKLIIIGQTDKHQWGLIYQGGIIPTKTSTQGQHPIRVLKKWKKK